MFTAPRLARVAFTGAVLVWLAATSAVPARAEAEISPAFKKKIVEFMGIIGAKNITRQVALTFSKQLAFTLKQSHPEIDNQAFAVIAEETEEVLDRRSDEILDHMVPVYAKHFSESDIDALLEFYRSPVGRKTVTEMPGLMQECMELAAQQSRDAIPDIQERVVKKLKAEGLIEDAPQGKAKDKPAATKP
jgi:hypothetical protein